MNILVINSGSSSLKYQLLDVDTGRVLAKGLVDKIGFADSEFRYETETQQRRVNMEIFDHSSAIRMVLDSLLHPSYGVLYDISEIDAVGHRIVHGGSTFEQSVLINDEVISKIVALYEVAPLHNPAAVAGIRACLENMPNIPMTAVFDTSFHQTMPPSSYIYALDFSMYEKHGIRRYGFHGTSHKYVSQKMLELMDKPPEETKIITCHLGNGASITAVLGGKSIDTSMGYTPLAGLVMGTRCGDIDPAIIPYMMNHLHMSPDDIDILMNKKSGLLGISGVSSDVRDIEAAAANGNKRAKLAMEVLCKRVVHYIGAYAAEMNGVDAIVFTGGIGENAINVRAEVCRKLTYLGLDFDEAANNTRGELRRISTDQSKVQAYIIPTNEELLIAMETRDLLMHKTAENNE